jgi:hypothetical protein
MGPVCRQSPLADVLVVPARGQAPAGFRTCGGDPGRTIVLCHPGRGRPVSWPGAGVRRIKSRRCATGWTPTSSLRERSCPSPFRADEMAVVFTGAMDYWPNIDAVSWFAADILPRLRQNWPQLRFYIVGRSPTAAVQALAGEHVVVSGTVPDVRPYLQHAAVVVAPLRLARGVQNKVLEAMAMGVAGGRLPGVFDGDRRGPRARFPDRRDRAGVRQPGRSPVARAGAFCRHRHCGTPAGSGALQLGCPPLGDRPPPWRANVKYCRCPAAALCMIGFSRSRGSSMTFFRCSATGLQDLLGWRHRRPGHVRSPGGAAGHEPAYSAYSRSLHPTAQRVYLPHPVDPARAAQAGLADVPPHDAEACRLRSASEESVDGWHFYRTPAASADRRVAARRRRNGG